MRSPMSPPQLVQLILVLPGIYISIG